MSGTKVRSIVRSVAFVAFGMGLGCSAAVAFQGHMFTALGDLHAARNQLSVAIPDKAGHRVAALGLVDQALGEVNAGIASGAR